MVSLVLRTLVVIVPGKWFDFHCYPIRWYMGDGSMAHPVAYVDEENIDPTVPDRKYKYCGTGYGDEEEYGLSCLDYIQRLFNRNK